MQIADSVKHIGVKSAYGDPVEVDGATLVPVSLVWFGFGGGSDGAEHQGGSVAGGGGGGGMAIPIGAYVKTSRSLRFQPNVIALLGVLLPLVTMSVPVLFFGGRSMSRVIRALKKRR